MQKDRLEITVEASVENLAAVLGFVRSAAAGHRAGDALKKLLVCVEEVFVNICRHAYGAAGGPVCVAAEIEQGFAIVLRDSGVPFDPLAHPDPDTGKAAAERPVGGLGILLVKRYMRGVAYARAGGQNVLTLRP